MVPCTHLIDFEKVGLMVHSPRTPIQATGSHTPRGDPQPVCRLHPLDIRHGSHLDILRSTYSVDAI